jgi:hypothetical protein
VTTGSATSSYIYNAIGQLIEKAVGSVTTLLVYDEAGDLLGEYSRTGALMQGCVVFPVSETHSETHALWVKIGAQIK